MILDILYQDADLIAINKPHGLLVHRSDIARDVSEFALQILRDQINTRVFPLHRLDRKTGGVLLFAFREEVVRDIQQLFLTYQIQKKYLAIVRGHTADQGCINYGLKNEKGKEQEAYTEFKTLEKVELEIPFGKYQTQRYSLVEVSPKTGRMHQIRKHFAHILHPVIGDRPHGCNKQNKLFKEKFNMTTMLLHAHSMRFRHPATGEHLRISAPLQPEFLRMLTLMGFDDLKNHQVQL